MSIKDNYSEDLNSFFFSEQNKKLEKKLKDKFGMKSMGSTNDASPEIINNFLNNVEKFEESWENAEQKKIIEILEYPNFTPLEDLNSEKLSQEIEKVFEIYAKHDFDIDIIEKDDVTDEAFYKFLTEELPKEETDYMPTEGFISNYIYEDFHPSNKLDAKYTVDIFLSAIIGNDKDEIMTWISKDNLIFNGKCCSSQEFIEYMQHLIPDKVTKTQLIFKNFEFGEQNKVEFDFIICDEEIMKEYSQQKQKKLHLLFDLEKSEYGAFNVKACYIDKTMK